jgi:hypothetical protein
MWSRSRIKRMRRTLGAILVLGATLAGCSDIYYDRRETIALGADDHLAVDEVVQIIDPWPAQSGKRRIAFDGQKMQSAVERYRTGRVIPPVNVTTSSAAYQAAQQAAAATLTGTQTTLSAPAAPVR